MISRSNGFDDDRIVGREGTTRSQILGLECLSDSDQIRVLSTGLDLGLEDRPLRPVVPFTQRSYADLITGNGPNLQPRVVQLGMN